MKNQKTGSTGVLSENLSEPLNGTTTAKVDINAGDGNLVIDRLNRGEPMLATGSLEYFEKQGQPTRTLNTGSGQATFTLKGGGPSGRPWLRLPWAACNGATTWQIHLNPTVSFDIKAHSNGGNVTLDLTGMVVTSLAADTGGGNMDVFLPDHAADLKVEVKSGAGNVSIQLPDGRPARIHATTGLGKVIVDPYFSKIDNTTYQSNDFDQAAHKVEITAQSGAGNVSVSIK